MLNLAYLSRSVLVSTLENLTTMRGSTAPVSMEIIVPCPKRGCSMFMPMASSSTRCIPLPVVGAGEPDADGAESVSFRHDGVDGVGEELVGLPL